MNTPEKPKKTTDDLFRKKPYLFWGHFAKCKAFGRIKGVAFLNYGDMPEIEVLLAEMGAKKVKKIFDAHMQNPRQKGNYYKELIPFLSRYLEKHANFSS